jgi:hypothetical protein
MNNFITKLLIISLIPRQECRFGMFENRSLKRVFGPKREKLIGRLRKVKNEKRRNLDCSSDSIKVLKSNRFPHWDI